jgi:hypothetical protein
MKSRAAALSAAAAGLAAALVALVIAGCCGFGPDPWKAPPDTEPAPTPGPSPTGGTVPGSSRVTGNTLDLGLATFPAGTPKDAAALHTWTAKSLRPPSYKLGYALARTEADALREAFRRYGRSVRFSPGSGGRFSWTPPRGCAGDMRCVFDELAVKSRAGVEPIATIFKRRQKEGKLDAAQIAALIVGFVQYIRYEVPKDEPFGLLPPAIVAQEKRGDCDSKALLAHMLLTHVGVDSIMLSSTAHRHAMLGVALPSTGTVFTHQGRRYAFTECTAKGSPIGHINPELLRPNDWRAVPVRLSAP